MMIGEKVLLIVVDFHTKHTVHGVFLKFGQWKYKSCPVCVGKDQGAIL